MRFPTVRPRIVAATLAVALLASVTMLATGAPSTIAAAAERAAVPAGAALVAAERAASPADAALVAELDKVLANAALAGGLTSVQVLDGSTGEVVYSKAADQRVIPASNEKLVTSAAALAYLGPDFQFHTTASYRGSRKKATVDGDLILKGTGDPTLTEARFDRIAAAVSAAGITKVQGDLVADDSAFDRIPLGVGWAWDDESRAFSAPISALTAAADDRFDTGSVAVRTGPGSAVGGKGTLSVRPRNSYAKIRNNTVTGAAGSADTVTAERRHGSTTVVVSGSTPLQGTPSTDLVAVESPTLLAASVFRAALAKHDVKVTGKTVVKASTGTVKDIVDVASIPLGELMVPFLKLSNNGIAELLTKAIGRKASGKAGSWSNGVAQIRTTLAGLGVTTDAVTLVDGSGLSRRNFVTTRQIATLLRQAEGQPWFDTWYKALPVAGADGTLVGGTLRNRFRGTAAANNLHAKTGTLTSVDALSGFVDDATGRRLVFSMVSNNATSSVVAILDQAAVQLAAAGSKPGSAETSAPPEVSRVATLHGEGVECSWINAC